MRDGKGKFLNSWFEKKKPRAEQPGCAGATPGHSYHRQPKPDEVDAWLKKKTTAKPLEAIVDALA